MARTLDTLARLATSIRIRGLEGYQNTLDELSPQVPDEMLTELEELGDWSRGFRLATDQLAVGDVKGLQHCTVRTVLEGDDELFQAYVNELGLYHMGEAD